MEAIAEGNRLMFVAGNNSYSIECPVPVVDGPGAWYLWVQFEPVRDLRPGAGVPELALRD